MRKNALVSSRKVWDKIKFRGCQVSPWQHRISREKKKICLPLAILFPPASWGPLASLLRLLTHSLGSKATINLDSLLRSRDFVLQTKICLVKAIVFPVHVWMWELDHRKGWALEHRRTDVSTMVLEKTLESPLDCKEIKPVNPKGNQSWVLVERTDAEVEAQILWPPDAKSQLIRKDPDAGKRLKARGDGNDRGWNS